MLCEGLSYDEIAAKFDVPVRESGRRIGEARPRAKLTRREIKLIQKLCEDEARMKGKNGVISYRDIAAYIRSVA